MRIRDWKAAGYRFELVYLLLPSAEHSIARVAHRVSRGGHGIPEDTLRRRFVVSGAYLESTYKPLADDWKIYASGGETPELLDLGTAMNKPIFDQETVLKALRRAADMAKNGTREEKSGKFLPPPGWKGRLITGAPGELDDLKPKPAKGKAA